MTKQEFTDLKKRLLSIRGEVEVTKIVEEEDKFIVTMMFPYSADYSNDVVVDKFLSVEEAIIEISKFADNEIENMIGHLTDQISTISKELLG